MRILSLFDGMACGAIAFKELGIDIERYVAFEVDKYAVKTACHNFDFIEQRGDVFAGDFTEFEGFDFLVGGSPCTYWSIAQTNNRETTASGIGWELFSQYVRALKEAKPKYFIYENNKSMSKDIRRSITDTFGFEPICINSALVSAQNRNRLYWVGVRCEDGAYKSADLCQPKDKGIMLNSILETGCDLTTNNKSWALTASYDGAIAWNTIERSQRNMVAELVEECFRVKEATTQGYTDIKFGGCVGMSMPNSKTRRGRNMEKKSNCLQTSCQFYQYCGNIQTPIYEVKDGMITIKGKTYPIKLVDGYYIIRKLTVRECMRLQTVPEWYEFPVSKTQAYKMLGNGWTVEVIKHLIKCATKGA